MLGDTENFGLTRVGQGETLAKNGYAALTTDRTFLDRVMQAMLTHAHDGGDRLPNPDQAPTLTTEQGDPDAMLPGGRTYYYRYSFIDRFGLETSGSPEAAIATPPELPLPRHPTLITMYRAVNSMRAPTPTASPTRISKVERRPPPTRRPSRSTPISAMANAASS